jgi:hypothetical protein
VAAEFEGRVVFAGTDIAPAWFGWSDGALESAAHAVEAVERLLGRQGDGADRPVRLRRDPGGDRDSTATP